MLGSGHLILGGGNYLGNKFCLYILQKQAICSFGIKKQASFLVYIYPICFSQHAFRSNLKKIKYI
jgi:hypothetical protein